MEPLAERFTRKIFPILNGEEVVKFSEDLARNPLVNLGKLQRSNTTVFAIKYADGALIAGDRRTSSDWYEIASDFSVKVKQLSGHSAIACAGSCSVIQYIEENMESICRTFREQYSHELSPDGQAKYLSKLLRGWFFSFALYYWIVGVPILATYDVGRKKPRIFEMSEDGFCNEEKIVVGTGCGFRDVKRLILDRWQKDLDLNAALELAARAMLHSGAASHGVSDIRIVLPTVAVIESSGFRWLDEAAVAKAREQILNEEGGWLQCQSQPAQSQKPKET